VKFIIMEYSPLSVFLPFRSKYPQNTVIKNLHYFILKILEIQNMQRQFPLCDVVSVQKGLMFSCFYCAGSNFQT